MFHGIGDIREAALHLDGLKTEVRIPGEFIDGVNINRNSGERPDATEVLRDELYTGTGTRDDAKFIPLVLRMADLTYDGKVDDNAGAMILVSFGPLGGIG
ncbi:hypothetical protein TsFJ059_002958 [Trichoderma semiorbis]|uniref:Uncharacterized protein n=1 Tax=Trichoderma semiorbis TaxID=1491008 RepID=A0A9P8HHX8_9HYPO|nr:hypothetical protein TsFJ059_002958 [Trichoderma semiorbis]